MPRPPKLTEVIDLVRALEDHPFGSLVLILLVLAMSLVVWATRHGGAATYAAHEWAERKAEGAALGRERS